MRSKLKSVGNLDHAERAFRQTVTLIQILNKTFNLMDIFQVGQTCECPARGRFTAQKESRFEPGQRGRLGNGF